MRIQKDTCAARQSKGIVDYAVTIKYIDVHSRCGIQWQSPESDFERIYTRELLELFKAMLVTDCDKVNNCNDGFPIERVHYKKVCRKKVPNINDPVLYFVSMKIRFVLFVHSIDGVNSTSNCYTTW